MKPKWRLTIYEHQAVDVWLVRFEIDGVDSGSLWLTTPELRELYDAMSPHMEVTLWNLTTVNLKLWD